MVNHNVHINFFNNKLIFDEIHEKTRNVQSLSFLKVQSIY